MTKIVYAGADHARGRLVDTLIRVGDEPCIVLGVGGNIHLSLDVVMIKDEEHRVVNLDDANLEPVPLGNVNGEFGFGYASRIPHRRWKQGLRKEAIFLEHSPWRFEGVKLRSKSLRDTILGIYPSFDEAINKLGGDVRGYAFSRSFGVGFNDKRELKLFYKGNEIGDVGDNIYIKPEFFFLKEAALLALNGE